MKETYFFPSFHYEMFSNAVKMCLCRLKQMFGTLGSSPKVMWCCLITKLLAFGLKESRDTITLTFVQQVSLNLFRRNLAKVTVIKNVLQNDEKKSRKIQMLMLLTIKHIF